MQTHTHIQKRRINICVCVCAHVYNIYIIVQCFGSGISEGNAIQQPLDASR